MSPRVAIIDDHFAAEASDERRFFDRRMFHRRYGDAGYELAFCAAWDAAAQQYTVDSALSFVDSANPDVVLLDVRFGDQSRLGLEILSAIGAHNQKVPVIVMTSTPREGGIVNDAFRSGAVDYLVKPFDATLLRETLDRYLDDSSQYWLIGQSEPFLRAIDQVARAAEGGSSSILLLGPSGSGKEVFARYAHRHGPRRNAPLQIVHIPSIPEHLLEGELFGYRKGAFTGALRDEPGRLIRADGGILFIDEVADLTPAAQAALLRVLESGEVTRLGDGRVKRIDIQVVAATNADLASMVKANAFRLDLYSRLGGTVVQLPPLAARSGDIPMLLVQLMRRLNIARGLKEPFYHVPDGAADVVRRQAWPGNVRELWNVVQRVADAARGEAITIEHFVAAAQTGDAEQPLAPLAAVGSDSALRLLDANTVRNAAAYLDELAVRELTLLLSALDLTRDPVDGKPSRARAVAFLKGKRRCSTNDFDRWIERVFDRMSATQRTIAERQYQQVLKPKNTTENA